MKKIFTVFTLCSLCFYARAQQPYPVAPVASGNINAIEYFINQKLEFGSGTALAGFTPSTNLNSFSTNVNLAGLPPGFHRIYFRSKSANGKWSMTNNIFFDNYNVPIYNAAPPAPVQITGMEYYFNNFQNFGSGTPLTGFTNATNVNSFNGSLNLTGLTPGFHRIYIRTKDANGKWSMTANNFLDNYVIPVYNLAPVPASNLVQLEYYLDNNDAGFGNCIQIPITPNTNINNLMANINITGLTPAVHRLFIRSKDAAGKWSLVHFSVFDNSALTPYPNAPASVTNMVQVEYFIDYNDAGFGNCIQIPITPGTNLANQNANINISGLAPGVHRLNIRSKDASGKWSLTNFSVFDNSASMPYPAAPAAAAAINNMEYFIDTDPGFGNATALTVPGNGGDLSNYSINLNLSGSLSVGTHYLYIRSKQNPWSLTSVIPFSASGIVPVLWSFVKAQLINAQSFISWATLQESNSHHFEIEHSTDGSRFLRIGEIAAAGNSSSLKNYNFTHNQPVAGFNFYRIKQVDNDGQFKYAPIVSVLNNEKMAQTIIAPNPVVEVLHVAEPIETFIESVAVYSNSGALLIRKNIKSVAKVYSLPVSNLPAGNYVIQINYKNKNKSYPFIKK